MKNQIHRSDLSTMRMTCGNEKKFSKVILDGAVRQWVGFGWVNEGEPTADQLKSLPIVVD